MWFCSPQSYFIQTQCWTKLKFGSVLSDVFIAGLEPSWALTGPTMSPTVAFQSILHGAFKGIVSTSPWHYQRPCPLLIWGINSVLLKEKAEFPQTSWDVVQTWYSQCPTAFLSVFISKIKILHELLLNQVPQNILSWKRSTEIIKFQLLDLHRTAPRLPPQVWQHCSNSSWALAELVLYPNRESSHSTICLTNCRTPHSKHFTTRHEHNLSPMSCKVLPGCLLKQSKQHMLTLEAFQELATLSPQQRMRPQGKENYSVRFNPRTLREQPDGINW